MRAAAEHYDDEQALPDRRRRNLGEHAMFAGITIICTFLLTMAAFGYPIYNGWLSNARAMERYQTEVDLLKKQQNDSSSSFKDTVAALQNLTRDVAQLQAHEQADERNVQALQTFQSTTTTLIADTNGSLKALKQQLDDWAQTIKTTSRR